MSRVCLLGVALAVSSARAEAVPSSVRAHAVRRAGPIQIDGKLDEPAWQTAPKQSGFVQRFPNYGAKATFDTAFAVLYDDEAIYVGVWASDPDPEHIHALLTRRDVDVAAADSVSIAFDSYHDRRTAFVFQLNAAGVQRDMLVFDDANQDDTWDAVWTGDVARTPAGWTAEFRIPLNQLRFASGDTHEWGLQVQRIVGRTAEQDTWSPWPRSAPEIVSKFGVVDGIDHLQPGERLELLPYVSGGVDRQPIDAGDPLNKRYSIKRNVGIDVKYGLGPAFTLSATINPDFGQVEADPSKVNLSANELFFAEKRPFFLEGVDLFKLPIGNSDNSVEGQFYSRRIGAAPPDPDIDYKYIDKPQATTIYSAAKLTGKTPGGWSVGILDAVTAEENATLIDNDGNRQHLVVAPLTNFAIGRIKRDFRDGKTSIGASATAVDRNLSGTGLEGTLHDQAYTGGLQLQHRWDDNAWQASISTLGSWVHGTPDAIAETQQSARHYWQRPDATDVHFDPTRTSMAGFGAKWNVGQLGDTTHWRYGFGGDLRSPGLELNDAGFQFNSDRLIPFVWGQYHDEEPTDDVLNWQVNSDVYEVQTLEPRITDVGLECNGNVQFANYWQFSTGCNIDRAKWNVNALRGGRALHVDPHASGWINIVTDTRKPVWFSFNFYGNRDWTADEIDGEVDLGATIQARSNLDLYLGPTYVFRSDPMQYVDEVADQTGMSHFIFARIHETDTALTMRVNWTFSPHLTLQMYAQPYIAAGRYSEYKDVDNPGAPRFADRFHLITGNDYQLTRATPDEAGTYTVNRNSSTFSFDRPDFDFRQLRSTVVLRWEYLPGSTVFAIWSHGRTSSIYDGRYQLGHDLAGLANADSENLVMIKANYWIGL